MIGLTTHQKKALNINSSISLTANAGSGKTFVLAQRFLEIILNTDTKIREVAAITFTEKAAGELYKRISDEINKVMNSTDNIQLKQRAEKIRKQIVSAKISTIHSFCIDLLKEFPVEASVDANFIPINAQRTQEIINLSIEKSIKVLLNDPEYQPDVKLLVRLLGSKSTLTRELNSMLQKRNNVLSQRSELYSANVEEITQKYFELFKSNLKIILKNDLKSIIENLNILNEEVLADNSNNQLGIEIKNLLNELNKGTDEIKLLKLLKEISDQLLTKDGSIRKQNYLNTKLRDKVNDSVLAVERFFEDISKINFDDQHKNVEKELVKYVLTIDKIFDFVHREFENTKSELGVLDFEDILLKTKKLIDIYAVKQVLAGKYKYLLVDEYQDTNEMQYNIFLPLLDDLKRGNLFIVGDEKQSIYRFRDAELQVFARTISEIQKVSGQDSVLTLPDSFRLAPSICFFVNSVFKNLFQESRPFFNEVKSSDLVCARSDDFLGKVEFLISEGEENDEAELIAKMIIRLKSDNPERIKNWSDIAVLVRKRVSFTDLQNVFIKYNIPFSIVGGTGFYQQQSISDIYNYFSFLLNDKDDAALIGLLRSPFFFVSDAELFELSLLEGENFWKKLRVAANMENQIWVKIFATLSENKNLVDRVSTPQLLKKILSESYFISALSSRVDGLQEISNLNKLITITNNFFTEEFNTLYDYVSYLSDAISNTGDEAQAGIEPGSRGVNILTIHQAKGLEFPAVFLYKCNDYTKIDKVKSRSFTIDKNFGLLTKIPSNENYFGEYHSAPIVGLYDLIESKKDYAELKRLLYVAMTRAKDFLFISQFKEKTLKKNSFAGLLNEALDPDYDEKYFNLSGELVFLEKAGNLYTNKSRSISLDIPIVKDLQADEIAIEKEKSDRIKPKVYLSRIKEHSIGELVSATRFSTFYSCPRKYNLMYNYRISDLVFESGKYKSSSTNDYLDEYNRNELESYLLDNEKIQTGLSRIKGKHIHYILSKNLKKESLPEFIESCIRENVDEVIQKSLKDDIINDLASYYDSKQYKYLNSFTKFRNEYELYVEENDYYLFGILDKIIFDNSKLIIVDYKTDNIVQNDINEKAKLYLPQLKFYAYIISRIFKDVQEIECRIIFLKFPENPVVFNYDKYSDKEINKTIKTLINSIRTGDYSLNLGHCKECIFSDNNSGCIQIID